MKAGRVVTIRLNPRDCMAVVDLVQQLGAPIERMSFGSVVSLALTSALQTLRSAKMLPERDGFEYSEIMAGFQTHFGFRKEGVARQLSMDRNAAAGVEAPHVDLPTEIKLDQSLPGFRKKKLRYDELMVKMRHAPESMEAAEVEEFNALQAELFPG